MFDLSSTKTPATGRARSVADAVPALFDKELLKDEVAVEGMIRSFERHFANLASNRDDTLTNLAQLAPHALAFVLSGRSSSDDFEGYL